MKLDRSRLKPVVAWAWAIPLAGNGGWGICNWTAAPSQWVLRADDSASRPEGLAIPVRVRLVPVVGKKKARKKS